MEQDRHATGTMETVLRKMEEIDRRLAWHRDRTVESKNVMERLADRIAKLEAQEEERAATLSQVIDRLSKYGDEDQDEDEDEEDLDEDECEELEIPKRGLMQQTEPGSEQVLDSIRRYVAMVETVAKALHILAGTVATLIDLIAGRQIRATNEGPPVSDNRLELSDLLVAAEKVITGLTKSGGEDAREACPVSREQEAGG